MKNLAENLDEFVKALVILALVGASIYLSSIDKDYREHLSNLAFMAVGGYLGQLIPHQLNKGKD